MKKIILLLSCALVFSSLKSQINHWETVVYENLTWKYLEPTTPLPASWNTISFNDLSWPTGQGGFGFGDGDDNTILPGANSIYQRINFTIVDTANIQGIILNLDLGSTLTTLPKNTTLEPGMYILTISTASAKYAIRVVCGQ